MRDATGPRVQQQLGREVPVTTSGGDGSAHPVEDARVVRTRNDVSRAALHLLVEQGWDAVTHARLAQAAGYSRATLYKHWPARTDLLRLAFARLDDMPHHVPTGDLRSDLIEEVTTFRTGMEQHRLDRALCVLVDLAAVHRDMAELRDQLVTDGEQVVRRLLAPLLQGRDLEAATLMLCGAVLHSALMHGQLPGDDVIAAAVDLVLRDVEAGGSPDAG
jgi:AcrR family transcriptional regulator